MLIESVSHYGGQTCVVPVASGIVDVVKISSDGYGQLVIDGHGVHEGYVLLKAGSAVRPFTEFGKNRRANLYVESAMQSPTVPSSESQRITAGGVHLTLSVQWRKHERVLMLALPLGFRHRLLAPLA